MQESLKKSEQGDPFKRSRLAGLAGRLAGEESCELAIKAAKVLGIDIGGVDVIQDIETGKLYVLEVNSAPRWESISQDCGVNVEREIVHFLSSLI